MCQRTDPAYCAMDLLEWMNNPSDGPTLLNDIRSAREIDLWGNREMDFAL